MTVRTGTIQDAVYYGVFTDDANKQNDRLDGLALPRGDVTGRVAFVGTGMKTKHVGGECCCRCLPSLR